MLMDGRKVCSFIHIMFSVIQYAVLMLQILFGLNQHMKVEHLTVFTTVVGEIIFQILYM